MAEESGDLRGICPQHPQALTALIGNPEVPQKNSDPTRIRGGACIRFRPYGPAKPTGPSKRRLPTGSSARMAPLAIWAVGTKARFALVRSDEKTGLLSPRPSDISRVRVCVRTCACMCP